MRAACSSWRSVLSSIRQSLLLLLGACTATTPVPPPRALWASVDVGEATAGGLLQVAVEGALPGATYEVVVGVSPATDCGQRLAGRCSEVAGGRPVVAEADGDTLAFALTLPSSASGDTLYVQLGARLDQRAALSDVFERVLTAPDEPGPALFDPDDDCVEDLEFFALEIEPLLFADCAQCHTVGGAGPWVVVPVEEPDHTTRNWDVLAALALPTDAEGRPALIDKATGVGHGGGARVPIEAWNRPTVDEAEVVLEGETSGLWVANTGGASSGGYYTLREDGQMSTTWTAPSSGTYVLETYVFGEQAGDALPHLVVRVDGRVWAEASVAATSLVAAEVLTAEVSLEAGEHVLTLAYDNEFFEPPGADRNLMVDRVVVRGPMSVPRTDWDRLWELVNRVAEPGACQAPSPAPLLCDPTEPTPGSDSLRRLTEAQYLHSVTALLGVTLPDGIFPGSVSSRHWMSSWASANPVTSVTVRGMLDAAEEAARLATTDLAGLLGCPVGGACVDAFTVDFVTRAFRRAPTTAELDVFTTLMVQGTSYTDRVVLLIEAVLQSPQFLYLDPRAGLPVSDTVSELDDRALATRLAYALTDYPPDAELLDLADRGLLRTPDQVRSQASRLLESPEAIGVLQRFHRDWLQLFRLATQPKDPWLFPTWDPGLQADLAEEIDRFVADVVWPGDRTLDALLYDRHTYTSPALDAIYGTTSERSGEGWELRELDGRRPGVLSRAAFHAAHSHATSTSPVQRGVFVLQELLCQDLRPPPGIPTDLGPPTAISTVRDRLATHRADPSCAPCHDQIDPVGLSMEHYGVLGAWRDTWANGIPVDSSGTLNGVAVDGLTSMLSALDMQAVSACYARRWFEYTAGRAARTADACTLAALEASFLATGGALDSLLLELTVSDAFLFRSTPLYADP